MSSLTVIHKAIIAIEQKNSSLIRIELSTRKIVDKHKIGRIAINKIHVFDHLKRSFCMMQKQSYTQLKIYISFWLPIQVPR